MAKLIIKNKYGIIPNQILNNPNLSLRAKGLFGFLQSKPDGWAFSIERISKQTKEGKSAIREAIKELENLGMLRRKPDKDNKGKWNGYDYILSENPSSDYPTTEKPTTENCDTLSNIDNSNTDIVKKNKIIAKQSFTGNEINQLIELFKNVNPSYEQLFKNKSQRLAIERMLKKYGREKLESIIKFLPKIFGKKYAPVITTPYLLELKMANLVSYIKQRSEEDNDNKAIIL